MPKIEIVVYTVKTIESDDPDLVAMQEMDNRRECDLEIIDRAISAVERITGLGWEPAPNASYIRGVRNDVDNSYMLEY